MWTPTCPQLREGRRRGCQQPRPGIYGLNDQQAPRVHRGSGNGMSVQGERTQHGRPDAVAERVCQPEAREGQAGPHRESERPIVPSKPGNAGGGKGPWFKAALKAARAGSLVATPDKPAKAQKPQKAPRCAAKGLAREPRSRVLVREPDAGDPHVRFDERDVETEHGTASEALATERARNKYAAPKPPRHVSTLRAP